MPDILTEEQKSAISQAIRDLRGVKSEVARAKRAGIDVAIWEENITQLETSLQGIKREYIDRPTPRT